MFWVVWRRPRGRPKERLERLGSRLGRVRLGILPEDPVAVARKRVILAPLIKTCDLDPEKRKKTKILTQMPNMTPSSNEVF